MLSRDGPQSEKAEAPFPPELRALLVEIRWAEVASHDNLASDAGMVAQRTSKLRRTKSFLTITQSPPTEPKKAMTGGRVPETSDASVIGNDGRINNILEWSDWATQVPWFD